LGRNEAIDEPRLPSILIQQPQTLLPLQTENARDGQEELQASPPFLQSFPNSRGGSCGNEGMDNVVIETGDEIVPFHYNANESVTFERHREMRHDHSNTKAGQVMLKHVANTVIRASASGTVLARDCQVYRSGGRPK